MANWQYIPDQGEVQGYADAVAERFFLKLQTRSDLLNLARTYWSAEPYSYSSTKGILGAIGAQENGPFSAEQRREILQMLRDSALEVRRAEGSDEQDSLGKTAHHLLRSVAVEAIGAEYSGLITDEQQQHDSLRQYFSAIGLDAITKCQVSLEEKKDLARFLLSQQGKSDFSLSPDMAQHIIQDRIKRVKKDAYADQRNVGLIFNFLRQKSSDHIVNNVLVFQEVQKALSEDATFETGVFRCPEGIDLSFLSANPQPNLFKTAAVDAYRYVQDEGRLWAAVTRENTVRTRAETVADAVETRLSHMLYCKMVSCLSNDSLTNLSPDKRCRVIEGLEGIRRSQVHLPFRDYHPVQAEQLARVADTIPADPVLTKVFNAAVKEVAEQKFLARLQNWAQMPWTDQVAAVRGIVADIDRAFQNAAHNVGDSQIFTSENAPVLAIGRGFSEIYLDGLDLRTNRRQEVVLNFPYKGEYDKSLRAVFQGYENAVFQHYGTRSVASVIGSHATILDPIDFSTYICAPSQPLGEIIFCPRSVENNRRDPNPFWNYARPEDVLSDIVHRYHHALTLRFWRSAPSANDSLREGVNRYVGSLGDAKVLRTRISYSAVEAWNECVRKRENPPEILRRLMKNPLDNLRTHLCEAALSVK